MDHAPLPLQQALHGRYAFDRQIGRGGMASVYLADDRKHSRKVAIKVLDPEITGSLSNERFQREIETAAALVHPHILPVHDSGFAAGFLYYTMPYVAGESLQARLNREGRIGEELAVRIVLDVADALGYAHRHGLVHRDVKPGNILIADDGHAWIADFGVARAVETATSASFTSTGVVVGTPIYMSPEQAASTDDLDGRTDIYGLGCVLFECLAGQPPFVGSARLLLSRKIAGPQTLPAPRNVSPLLSSVIRRAMAWERKNRYPTADAFAQDLARAASRGSSVRIPLPAGLARRVHAAGGPRLITAAIVIILAVLVLWKAWPGGYTSVDPDRFAVLPFVRAQGSDVPADVEFLLADALGSWAEVDVATRIQVTNVLGRRPAPTTNSRAAREIARSVSAGRFVVGQFDRIEERTVVHAVLYATDSADAPIAEASVEVPASGWRDAFIDVANVLLFPASVPHTSSDWRSPGTRSLMARRALLTGEVALLSWDLETADSAFRAAVRADGNYVEAFLRLAQVAILRGDSLGEIEGAASRALRHEDRLDAQQRRLARAALLLGQADFETACALYDTLTRIDRFDFDVWYGNAECNRRDPVVVRDVGSPSGWAFRSSFHQAIQSYRQAFLLFPNAPVALRDKGYLSIRRVFVTFGRLRQGISTGPGSIRFLAYPRWQGDTLAFVPYPQDVVARGETDAITQPGSTTGAPARIFNEIAMRWSRADGGSVEAREAVSVSLAMMGDPTALDTLRAARLLVSNPRDRFRLATNEVWLLLKYGIPEDTVAIKQAVTLADSLLMDSVATVSYPELAAGLAGLLGLPHRAAVWTRLTPLFDEAIPLVLRSDARALLAYAAIGAPIDSIAAIEMRIEDAIPRAIPMSDVKRVRTELLAQAAMLAFPVHTFRLVLEGQTGDYDLDLASAWTRRDTADVRMRLRSIIQLRSGLRPADLTFDALLGESFIVDAVHGTRAAIEWLGPSIDALRWQDPWSLASVDRTASLIRAIMARADLADRSGDETGARRLRHVVRIVRPQVGQTRSR